MKTLSKMPAQPSIDFHPYNHSFSINKLVQQYIIWCKNLEDVRFLIGVTLIMIQGNLIVPITLLIMNFNSHSLTSELAGLMGACTLAVLVAILGLVPMKWTIGIFAINLIISLTIIIAHLL